MAASCTICASEHRPELDQCLAAGESARSLAAKFSLSLAAVYRHIKSGHNVAKPPQNGSVSSAALPQQISATLRDVQRLAREAQRHLREARKAGDHKATNGAITAAAKALELVGKLRGELQHGSQLNVQVSATAQAAIDLRSQTDALQAGDVTEQALAWLSAQVEAGDAHALAAVGELMRMLPSAEAATQPQALTAAPSPEPERVIPEPSG